MTGFKSVPPIEPYGMSPTGAGVPMSHRSGHHSEYQPHHHPQEHGRPSPRRSAPQHVAPQQAGYTITHAGRQVRFGPVVFWIGVGTVTLLGRGSVSINTGSFFSTSM